MIELDKIQRSIDSRRIDLEGRVLVGHQAEFMPWLGNISKASMGDIYLILDDSQYKKEYFENRNKIRLKNDQGWQWLTVPVGNKSHINNFQDVKIINNIWKRKHLNSIKLSYSRCKYFNEVYSDFSDIINSYSGSSLSNLNVEIISFALRMFDINVPIYRTSIINKTSPLILGQGTDLVISMCEYFNANVFVAGPSGRSYLIAEEFEKKDIKLVFQEFSHPKYTQIHGGFLPYMSFLDLLFNHGKEEAIKILSKSEYKDY